MTRCVVLRAPPSRPSSKSATGPVVKRRFVSAIGAPSVRKRSYNRDTLNQEILT